MKRLPAALIAALLVAAPGAEARFMPLPSADRRPPIPGDCSLVIGFSSYAVGIDTTAYRNVRQLLGRDRAVRAVTEHGMGREGEVTLCAHTRGAADANRLFHAIHRILPARPRGPIAMRTRAGLRYSTPPPPRRRR